MSGMSIAVGMPHFEQRRNKMKVMSNPQRRKAAIKFLFSLVLPIILICIPCGGYYTPEVKKFLAVTSWAIVMFATEAMHNTVVALVLMIMYVITGVMSFTQAFSPWTQELPWMMIGSFIIVSVIQRTSILKRIAYWCVIRTGGTYRGLLMGMVALGMIACILIPSTSAAVIVAAITFSICESLNMGKSTDSAGLMLAGQLGFMESYLFVYSPTFISVIFNTIKDVAPYNMDYWTFLKHNAIFIPYVFLVGFVMTLIIKPEVKKFDKELFKIKLIELGKMNVEEKKTLGVLIALIVYLFTYQWHQIPMVYGFMVAPALLYLPIINVGKAEDLKNVNYDAVIFIAACLSIGAGATAVGLGDIIVNLMTPILSNLNPVLFLALVWVLVVALNFLMTPVAEMTALGVPLARICQRLGIQPLVMCYTVFQGGSQLILPYEVTMWLVAYGFGNIPIKDFMRICGVKMLICGAYLMTIGMVYWKMIGLL